MQSLIDMDQLSLDKDQQLAEITKVLIHKDQQIDALKLKVEELTLDLAESKALLLDKDHQLENLTDTLATLDPYKLIQEYLSLRRRYQCALKHASQEHALQQDKIVALQLQVDSLQQRLDRAKKYIQRV